MAFMELDCQPAVPGVFQGCNVLQQTVARRPQKRGDLGPPQRDCRVTDAKSSEIWAQRGQPTLCGKPYGLRRMFPRFASASTEHPQSTPSISLVAASGTGISLVVPPRKNDPIPIALRRDTMFPVAVFGEIILILTLTAIMSGILKARLSPS